MRQQLRLPPAEAGETLRAIFSAMGKSAARLRPATRKRKLLALAIGTAILSLKAAQAATISVNSLLDDGDGANCTLREAISSANDDAAGNSGCVDGAGADTIVFSAGLSLPATVLLQPNVLSLTLASDVTIQGPGADLLTLDAGGFDRHFRIRDPDPMTQISVSILSMTLSNGTGGPGGAIFNDERLHISDVTLSDNTSSLGGAIFNMDTAYLSNVRLSNNTALYGGGLFNGGFLVLEDSSIDNSHARGDGGGIYNPAGCDLRLSRTTLQNNTAESGGGGLYNLGATTLNNVTLQDNTARIGGGFHNVGVAELEDSLVVGNRALATTGVNGDGGGGGIYNHPNGNLNLSRSTLQSNRAESGGGGLFNPGTATLANVTVAMNQAFDFGGGVDSNGTTQIVGGLIEHNLAMRGGGIWTGSLGDVIVSQATVSNNTATVSGGGLASDGSIRLDHSQLLDNTAVDGGGMFTAGNAVVRYSSVSGNQAIFDNDDMGGDGGGIHNVGGLVLTYSTLSNNTAASGGGGLFSPGDGDVRNTTLSGNQAGDFGGGLDAGGTMRVLHNTLVGNRGATGGGLFVSGQVNLLNTIVASSTTGGDCFVSPSGVLSPNNTLVEDGSCQPDIAADPLLGLLNDNGGPTQTHALLPGSPAIDLGTGLNLDQRGYLRDGPVDIGAFEFNAQPPPPIFSDGFESPPLFVPP